MNLVELSQRLKQLRQERGLSLEEVARSAGQTRSWLSPTDEPAQVLCVFHEQALRTFSAGVIYSRANLAGELARDRFRGSSAKAELRTETV